ncbi:MAG: UDP-N-acetylmuramoyl-L-alanyl-D-glutamate--2,6-diaminopimelate ligase [Chloroflexia bacterium]|nr:UDP-N-acetylmuramoyl-L-alanyl-D-glutamate--2,6-diaminopimelate ligase [Chloroflexia bacterium]
MNSSVSVQDLIADVPNARIIGFQSVRVCGVQYDSRRIEPGDLFAALRGGAADGHDYLKQAILRGASALLVELPFSAPPEGVAQIVVRNSRVALAPIAASFFGQPSHQIPVIGITGTDGKTTTSYLLSAIFRAAGLVAGLISTVAIRIGDDVTHDANRQTTPESVDVQRYLREMVGRGVNWAIVESTSHGLAQHRLDCTRFSIGAVTNITHEHLEFHKTIDAYRRAKAILLERVGAVRGTIVINADDDGAKSIEKYAVGASILRYSAIGANADFRAHDVRMGPKVSCFNLKSPAGNIAIELPLVGEFNIANALCAIAIASAAGVGLEDIAQGLALAPAVPGRMARIDAGQPFTVVVDYAHTPESLSKVLTLLRRLHSGGRLVVVSGSAGERDKTKRPLQGKVCAELADFSVFTSEDPRNEDPDEIISQIADGARLAGSREVEDYARITDRGKAIAFALGMACAGDCVLLAGKGHEQSIIWAGEYRPWDDASAAHTALLELGFSADPL